MPDRSNRRHRCFQNTTGKPGSMPEARTLLGELRDQCVADYPEALINIKTISDLDYIKTRAGG